MICRGRPAVIRQPNDARVRSGFFRSRLHLRRKLIAEANQEQPFPVPSQETAKPPPIFGGGLPCL